MHQQSAPGTIRVLSVNDIAGMMGVEPADLSPRSIGQIEEAKLVYEVISGEERDRLLLQALRTLDETSLKVSGAARQPEWDAGWEENLRCYLSSTDAHDLLPRYFKPLQILRIFREYARPLTKDFLPIFHRIIAGILFERYLSEINTVWEFGCGTGHNLLNLADIFPRKQLCGLDWAGSSVELVNLLREKHPSVEGRLFNMLSPDDAVQVPQGSAVITIHAMEQLGGGFEPFLSYLLAQPVSLYLHLEPIVELYEGECLVDYLAIKYHRKRGYLDGFLSRLRELERCGLIQLVDVRRLFIGSQHDEGYSLIVWKHNHL